MDSRYVWKKTSESFNHNNILTTVNYGGRSIMLWGYFAGSGPGEVVQVHGIMKKEDYLEIIRNNVKQSALKLYLGR